MIPKLPPLAFLPALPAALAAMLFFAPLPGQAQGYEGLIAAPEAQQPQKRGEEPTSGGGYEGLIAPAAPAGRAAPNQEPPGYEGLIQGRVPARPETAAAPPEQTPPGEMPAATPQPPATASFTPAPGAAGMTPRPGIPPRKPITTAEDLRALARNHGINLQIEELDAEAQAKVKVPAKAYSLASSPQPRIDGLLPAEMMVKKQIDQVMFSINMPNITGQQRRRNARAGYERLLKLADAFRTKSGISDAVYEQMGVPAIFVQEQKEANARALARLEEAFEVLRRLQ